MKLAKFVKQGLYIFTSIAVMGTLAGCAGQDGSMNKGKLVKIAVCVSSQTPASMAMREVFKPRLEELTEGKYIAGELEAEQPVTLMSWFPNGARAFSSNKKLEGLDDFKGQKLRMPNNPIHVKLAESLGANVVIMDMGEVFTALEQGVVDGQDNPLSTVKNEGWYEVQDYIYDTNHIVASLELFAGDQFWDSIDEADREIFRQVADETSDYAWDLYIDQLAGDKQFMKDNGLTVTDLSDEDREAMKVKIQPVYDYLDEKYEWAGDIRRMIEEIE